MSNNMREKFVYSNFDEIDIVMDTDRRFDEAIVAADNGEEDLVNVIIKDLKESGEVDDLLDEDNLIQYNPELDDAIGILDTTAEDYREYISEEDYEDDDGEIIDAIMNDEYYDE